MTASISPLFTLGSGQSGFGVYTSGRDAARQRWRVENEWHWARDTQLGEDDHCYADRTGAAVLSLLRIMIMNLLKRGGYH